MAKMKTALLNAGGAFSIFGGDPLLLPLDDLEELFAFGLSTYGSNGIQTNGALITQAHLAVFIRYKVHVGFSLDGPDLLNDSRWAGTLEETRAATDASQRALEGLLALGQTPSLIVTLYRGNATGPALGRLIGWLTELAGRGLQARAIASPRSGNGRRSARDGAHERREHCGTTRVLRIREDDDDSVRSLW